jgi:hypothetical protein
MNPKALLLELLVSGFFAIACLRARDGDFSKAALAPRDFLRLTPRLDRLSRTRWQWFSMVLLLLAVRVQSGVPTVVEITALAQFAIFLSLPVAERKKEQPSVRKTSRRNLEHPAS